VTQTVIPTGDYNYTGGTVTNSGGSGGNGGQTGGGGREYGVSLFYKDR
jgi:hypothetical protein